MTGAFFRQWALTVLLIGPLVSYSQTVVSGTVKTIKGKPLFGAAVAIVNAYDGGIVDSAGKFSFVTSETGKQTLEVKHVGHKTVLLPIDVVGKSMNVPVILRETINELDAVTVTAGSFEAGDKKRAATVMSSLDIVTTAGSNGDLSAALKTLPGAQQVGDQEGLFVRGGAGYETKQFIDGGLVSNPFFSSVPGIAQRGRFSPFLFKGTVFTTGGYSALYGQALSSALILETVDLPQRSEANASLSPIFTGAGFQHLAKRKNNSFGSTFGYTDLAAYFKVVKQAPDYFKVPRIFNGDANFRIKTKRGGMVKFYSSFTQNLLGLRRPNIDSQELKNSFSLNSFYWYNNLFWRESLGKGWKMQATFGYSINNDHIDGQLLTGDNLPVPNTKFSYLDTNTFQVVAKQQLTQAKLVIEKKLMGISSLRFGSEDWYSSNTTEARGRQYLLEGHLTSLFAETDIYLSNALALKAGSRMEYASVINKYAVAPRLSLAYKAGQGGQVGLAYGEFYQLPENAQLGYPNLDFTKAAHYIANYQKTSEGRNFRVEAYYKIYDQLVKTYPYYSNLGNGFARGIEFFFRDKKTIKDLDYWISYSYLDTKRDYLNFPSQLQPNFATPHTASFVVKRFVTKWKTGFNGTYSWATGRPYYDLAYSTSLSKFDIRDQGTTKAYSSLGFSVNYLPNLGKPKAKTFVVLVASVSNLLNRTQVFGYNYTWNGLTKQPVTLPANQTFFLGCFLNWGLDRSQDVINNNL